ARRWRWRARRRLGRARADADQSAELKQIGVVSTDRRIVRPLYLKEVRGQRRRRHRDDETLALHVTQHPELRGPALELAAVRAVTRRPREAIIEFAADFAQLGDGRDAMPDASAQKHQ